MENEEIETLKKVFELIEKKINGITILNIKVKKDKDNNLNVTYNASGSSSKEEDDKKKTPPKKPVKILKEKKPETKKWEPKKKVEFEKKKTKWENDD